MKNPTHGGPCLAQAIREAYRQGQTDYHMKPMAAVDAQGHALGKIADGDTVIFCCRRGEREIELTEMFTEDDFSPVQRVQRKNLHFVLLTRYHEKFQGLPVAFAPETLAGSLAQAVSDAGKTQFHCAESEKFAHITFFLNGGNHQPFPNETDLCIPSLKDAPFEQRPEMSLSEVTDATVSALGKYDLVAVNFANGDVIGHTASSSAKIAAAGHVSRCLHRLAQAAREAGYVALVTADHGNLERMLTPKGTPDVAHTCNPAPFVLIPPDGMARPALREGMSLASVAPTVLELMGAPKPPEMTAQSLLLSPPDKARRVLLVILDGWGLGREDDTNPIHLGDTALWRSLYDDHPHTQLHASGAHVGLGSDKPGNSEAGHMNLGAGRVVAQDDQRLEQAMKDGSFEQNPVFLEAIRKTQQSGRALHLLAYLTYRSSHGSIEYAVKLCAMARQLKQVYLHLILDGRSTENGSAPDLVMELEKQLEQIGTGFMVDCVGRGLVLDRDHAYEKVKQGYDAMVLGECEHYLCEG